MLWGVAAGARKKAFLTAEMGQRGGGGGIILTDVVLKYCGSPQS